MQLAMLLVRLKVAILGVALSTSIVLAQGVSASTSVKPTPQPGKSATPRMARQTTSLINGVAVQSDQTPLPNAAIRLRNLQLNAIEKIVTTNALGEFSFDVVPGVAYVVEMVDEAGRTVAVGDVILARTGEVAGAKLTLPSGLPERAGIYGDTARAVMSAATGIDLQVVDPSLPKLSPSQ